MVRRLGKLKTRLRQSRRKKSEQECFGAVEQTSGRLMNDRVASFGYSVFVGGCDSSC
jgi:hypothetical protein